MSLDIEQVTSIYKVFDYLLNHKEKYLENGLYQVETVMVTGNVNLSGLLDFIDSLLIDSVEIIHFAEQVIIDKKPFPQVQFTMRFLTNDWESLGIRAIKIVTDLKYGYMYLSWALKEKYENISIYAKKLNTDNF
jgi:hypothetical protein